MLDIAILGEGECPTATHGLRMREHEALMIAAKRTNARYLLRMHDYYGDATIESHELPEFREEILALLRDPALPAELSDIVRVLESFSARAIREGKQIVAIAD
jgi:hypothetical protein